MNKKDNRLLKFFERLWREVEPLVVELLVYSFLIIAVWTISYLTDPFIPEKLKENISYIKSFVVMGALILSAFHTLVRMLIRIIKSIGKEIKSNDEDKDNEDNHDNDNGDNGGEVKLRHLPPPAATDEINRPKNPERMVFAQIGEKRDGES